MRVLFLDTETTGLKVADEYPRLVELALILENTITGVVHRRNWLIIPDGFEIPVRATEIHGITNQMATDRGIPLAQAMGAFIEFCRASDVIVAHNASFDIGVLRQELVRAHLPTGALDATPNICTMFGTKKWVGARRKDGGIKLPNLTELHSKCFGEGFNGAHSAYCDTEAVQRCFGYLVKAGVLSTKKIISKKVDQIFGDM